jgi:hypothetical protein
MWHEKAASKAPWRTSILTPICARKSASRITVSRIGQWARRRCLPHATTGTNSCCLWGRPKAHFVWRLSAAVENNSGFGYALICSSDMGEMGSQSREGEAFFEACYCILQPCFRRTGAIYGVPWCRYQHIEGYIFG